MNENWKRDLERRAESVRRQEYVDPIFEGNQDVDINEDESRAIRQALLQMERDKSQNTLLVLAVLLSASLAANVVQAILHFEAIRRLH